MSHSGEADQENKEQENQEAGGRRGFWWRLLICLLLIAVGAGLIYWINASEPEAERTTATKETAMLVEVMPVQRGDYRPLIEGLGTVEAAQDIVLSPRVSGRVLEVSANFLPGGFVEQGNALLRIDPSDYRNAVRQAQSRLRQARSDLAIEMGRGDVAKREYELLDQTLNVENQSLVLREPQRESARAAVSSAEASLSQARLELERTTIVAPFNAQVLRQNANIGSQVAPGQNLGRLVGVDEYWVVTTVPVAKLDFIEIPANGEKGITVKIRNRAAWPQGRYRVGRLQRLIGAVDERTRLARLLVTVSDPLLRDSDGNGPKMIIGTVVNAEIQGRLLADVVRINRDHLRQDDRLWVMKEGKLDIREAEVVFRDSQYAYVRKGLRDGERIVTSNLATVAEGLALRTRGENDGGEGQ